MPRIKRGLGDLPKRHFPELTAALIDELRNEREAGQPIIEEYHFPTGLIRLTVIWDRWLPLSDEDRSSTILQAIEEAEGKEFADRIALAIGLTVPEAYQSGLLPFAIIAALRVTDAVTEEQCHQAMIEQGASLLFDPNKPQLRFGAEAEALAAIKRLEQSLPGSESVWLITQDVGEAVMK